MFLKAYVILFTGGGLPQCMLGHHPPGADPPQEQTPPTGADPPPGAEHAGRYGQCAGGMHPTGMQSCLHIYFHLK